MTRDELESAAFWGQFVCADCGAAVEAAEVAFACPECGSEGLVAAARVLQVLERLEGDDE